MRLPLLLVATSLALASCGEGPELTPLRSSSADAIVNGTRDPQRTFLTEGEIQAIGYLADARGDEFCSGTLVRPRVVVTARHCVQGQSAQSTWFGFGVLPADPDLLAPVIAIHEHPSIDFAILILGVDPTEIVSPLTPIDINREPIGRQWLRRWVDAAGFGNTYSAATGRFFAGVELVDFDEETVTVDGHGVRGICYGDSGGPVIWQPNADTAPVVVGTEQWGDSSCVDRDHLTRLDVVLPFFSQILSRPMPPAGIPCGDVEAGGTCRDGEALWCAGGYLQRDDCAGKDLSCGWMGADVGYHCLRAGCGETDHRGFCDGQVATWCDRQGLAARDCAAMGSSCGWLEEEEVYRCRPCSSCGGVCVDLETSNLHCGACDQTCAPANAEGSCDQGECSITACDPDWRDADGAPDNGCEQQRSLEPAEVPGGGGCASLHSAPSLAGSVSLAMLWGGWVRRRRTHKL